MTSESFHNALEKTLNGLEEKNVKKYMKISTLAAAVLAVLLALTAFAAAGFVSGIVDWNGNVISLTGKNDSLKPTPPPSSAQREDALGFAEIRRLLEEVPDYEYWEASCGEEVLSNWGMCAFELTDAANIDRMVSEIGVRGLVMPEGYTEKYACIIYEYLKLEKELYAQEEYEGTVLKKYTVKKPDSDKIGSYSAMFEKNDECRINVECVIYDDDRTIFVPKGFAVKEGDDFMMQEIEGFSKAIRIARDDGEIEINLLETLENGKTAYYSLTGKGLQDERELLFTIGIN